MLYRDSRQAGTGNGGRGYRELKQPAPGTGAGPTGNRGRFHRDWRQEKRRSPLNPLPISDRNS